MKPTSGFTLVETVTAMAIAGTIFTSLYLVSAVAVEQSATQQETQESLADAHRVMNEIETAIRLSDRVLKSGVNILLLETRYFIDDDAGIEQVRYVRSGNSLYRRISDEGGPLSEPELLLAVATSFQANKLRIRESFDREDFDVNIAGPIATGNARTANGAVQAEYDLKELGDVDADLLAAYSTEKERLEATGASAITATTMTVSPPMKKASLTVTTDFTPQSLFKEYRPLVFGAEMPDTDNISVVFESNGDVVVRTTEGGTLVEQSTPNLSWTPANAYKVRLEMSASKARAFISENGEVAQKVGIIDSGTMTTGSLHYQINGTGSAAWDSLEIDNDFLTIKLTTTLNGQSKDLWGGACSRQPKK
ncbi:MAG: prepilin-type N-terminal cleavage/methylation domain-containing protein [Planctomycetota bacterium]